MPLIPYSLAVKYFFMIRPRWGRVVGSVRFGSVCLLSLENRELAFVGYVGIVSNVVSVSNIAFVG